MVEAVEDDRMTVRALTLLFAVALVVRTAEFEEGDDVVVLMLTSEYTAAAKTLNELNPSICLIKGDTTVEIKLTEQFATRAFPTFKFFNVDVDAVKDYDGGRTSAEIEKWVAKKSGPATKILESVKELVDTKEPNDVAMNMAFHVFPNETWTKVSNMETRRRCTRWSDLDLKSFN
ncbi:hypothetical protein PF007_g21352 [Phytophthora fragariae]|uniref:Thioredoxin domain-containing protein n=1 Tax=Phytophthora fragariae TaxID=53985 RepID=A0A6A3QY35_9STRA|nr:hypothetical protein PF003_g6222 [Phytophthora fragariae]KAE9084880.1 hypothetical protein PF007_g21352 [Phytophthora fragariae]KAE9088522.1 hypothetical protein PF006_g25562 [Phytophthora fragariae]